MEGWFIFDYPNVLGVDLTWFIVGALVAMMVLLVLAIMKSELMFPIIIINIGITFFVVLGLAYIIVVALKQGFNAVETADLLLVILGPLSMILGAKGSNYQSEKCVTVKFSDGLHEETNCKKMRL